MQEVIGTDEYKARRENQDVYKQELLTRTVVVAGVKNLVVLKKHGVNDTRNHDARLEG